MPRMARRAAEVARFARRPPKRVDGESCARHSDLFRAHATACQRRHSGPAAVARLQVLVNPRPSAAPLPIRALAGVEPSPVRSDAQRSFRSKWLWDCAMASIGTSLCTIAPSDASQSDAAANIRPRGRSHPAWERLDVVSPEAPRGLTIGRVGMRRDAPDGPQSSGVDLADLGHREQLSVSSGARFERLAVDPLGGVGIAAHLCPAPLWWGRFRASN